MLKYSTRMRWLEYRVLGAMLANADACDLAMRELSADSFGHEGNQTVFIVARDLWKRDGAVDRCSLIRHLQDLDMMSYTGDSRHKPTVHSIFALPTTIDNVAAAERHVETLRVIEELGVV